jgi:hypothetical protein
MAFLSVECPVDDVAGIGQRGRELAIEVGVVLDDEQAQSGELRSMSADKLAIGGINTLADHFAIAEEQSQHIDEALAAPAQPGPQQLAPAAVLARRCDGVGKRNRPVASDGGALLRLAEAVAMGHIGGSGGNCGGQHAEKNGGRKRSENRHEAG